MSRGLLGTGVRLASSIIRNDEGVRSVMVFDPSRSALRQSELPAEIPLTESQQETWLASQFGEMARQAFVSSIVLHLDGSLNVAALEQALARLCVRHEALRLRFAADGSTQHVAADAPLPWHELDYSSFGAEAVARLESFCEEQSRSPFDLAQSPIRFFLVRLATDRHALLVTFHHLVMQSAALAVFRNELALCYNACMAGVEPPLAETTSFRACALADGSRRDDDGKVSDLDYWKRLYSTLPDPLQLPADLAEPSLPNFAAATEQHVLAGPLTAALRHTANRLGVGMPALLLSCFGVFLARMCGKHDFAVGVPFAGPHDQMIGNDVNTLPLRMDANPEAEFVEYSRRVQASLWEGARHRDVTLMRLMRKLDLHRRGAGTALSSVIFDFEVADPDTAFDGLEHAWRSGKRPAAMSDIELRIRDAGAQITLAFNYATARYNAATVRRWIGSYAHVLKKVADLAGCPDDLVSTDIRLDDFDLLDAATRTQVLETWNATAMDYDREQSLSAMIEAQMHRTPRRIAVECSGEQLDYGELERITAAAAHALRRRGIRRGDMVGVYVPRGLEMLIAVLAVLRCGAAYVPLDPEFPEERLVYMAEHAQLRHLLVTPAKRPPESLAAERELLAVGELAAESPDDEPLPLVHGGDLAYVLFTSGSTGQPKGVCILHRNLTNFLLSMSIEPGFDAADTLCVVTTLSFDIAGLEIYLPLITGGRMVIATVAEHSDPGSLFELIEQTGCNVLQTTPSLLRLLQEIGYGEVVRKLRLFVGGEPLPVALARALAGHCHEFWNLYGPTETTIWSTAARIYPDTDPIPLGRPIANTRIYVLDNRGRVLPPGVIGEIWIGGDGVADGYLFRPDLTDERFVADPFADASRDGDNARMYRTGDFGHWRDGVLYFNGRADHQIKIRGYRIEPGDIEAAAGADAGVRECIVTSHSFGENDLRLVLYVAADDDPHLSERLRARLHKLLPIYMQPQHIERLHALPKTPNGKIDRKALPLPSAIAIRAAATLAGGPAPTFALEDPRQEYLASIWRELIGVKDVRANDTFFDLGGHSLLAVEFATRVHRETSVRLRLLDIATGTLASLAAELAEPSAMDAESLPLLLRLRRRLGWD